MDMVDRLKELGGQIPRQLEHVRTEEATKTALVMPFISALGYNVFDPREVVPEFTADVGTKKGEKVDYALLREGRPIILFECKYAGADLDQVHASQLYRYFSVTPARIGILTNGITYRLFSDLEEPNKMDPRPFLEFSMLEVTDALAAELKKLAREGFDLENVLSTASDLKYRRGIKKALSEEWVNPSEELVRLFTCRVYSGRLTQAVRQQFAQIVKQALHEFLGERVNLRLKSALERESAPEPQREEAPQAEDAQGIVTTEDELEGFYVVRAILRDLVDVRRIHMRDRRHYCAILLDDTNRKPICRMWFNGTPRYLGLFGSDKSETKVAINDVEGIFDHAPKLRATVMRYEGKAANGDLDEEVDDGEPDLSGVGS